MRAALSSRIYAAPLPNAFIIPRCRRFAFNPLPLILSSSPSLFLSLSLLVLSPLAFASQALPGSPFRAELFAELCHAVSFPRRASTRPSTRARHSHSPLLSLSLRVPTDFCFLYHFHSHRFRPWGTTRFLMTCFGSNEGWHFLETLVHGLSDVRASTNCLLDRVEKGTNKRRSIRHLVEPVRARLHFRAALVNEASTASR